MSIQNEIFSILAQQAMLEPSDVTMNGTLEDLGIDSMGVVECIFAIEEQFDITIPFNANEPDKSDFDISSVATILSGIQKLISEK